MGKLELLWAAGRSLSCIHVLENCLVVPSDDYYLSPWPSTFIQSLPTGMHSCAHQDTYTNVPGSQKLETTQITINEEIRRYVQTINRAAERNKLQLQSISLLSYPCYLPALHSILASSLFIIQTVLFYVSISHLFLEVGRVKMSLYAS